MNRLAGHGHRWWAVPVALAALLPFSAAGSPPAVQAQATPVTLTFEFTGGPQTLTIPEGVTGDATFDVYGAQGGSRTFPGGLGGRAMATFPISPGMTFELLVGGQGAPGGDGFSPCRSNAGGFNGGGAGGDDGGGCAGSGGGGASDVRLGGSGLAQRILVAGGGGGASGNLSAPQAGSGGGLTGGSIEGGDDADGGQGGNQDGTTGSGAPGFGSEGGPGSDTLAGGGGGGGGYYGGQGGNGPFGGGGGSGFGPPGTLLANGVNHAHGRILVTLTIPPPTVTHISPSRGTADGDTVVTITGTTFIPGFTIVTFGGAPATAVSCTSSTTCTATSPPGTAGTVSVRANVGGQQSADTPADDYAYLAPPLITQAPSPPQGPVGTLVTITGVRFDTTPGATVVDFGSYRATQVHCSSTTQCTAVAPPNGPNTFEFVGLTVSTPPDLKSEEWLWAYEPDLELTEISPNRGPAAGGTLVTFTGNDFEMGMNQTLFFFGSTDDPSRVATPVGCTSKTQCTAIAPPGTGTVTVSAATLVGGTVAGPQFTYLEGQPPPDCSPADPSAADAEWSPLGGPYRSDPSVLTKCNVVFAVDDAGVPYYHQRIGGQWSAAIPLGGQLDSVAAPAEQLVGEQNPNFEIFGNGVDGAVWYRTRESGWESLGGALLSDPTAVIFDGQTYVFGVGLDDAVWYRTPHTDWASLGGHVVSDLGVTTDGTSLYVTGVGVDEAMWARRLTASTWHPWESLGGQVVNDPATTFAAGTGYLFVVGGDGAVWYQGVSGGTWSGWYGLGGLVESAPAAVAHDDGRIDVFVVGQDLAMWSQHWAGSHWSGWQDRGGGFISNPVVSTAEVFGIGLDELLYAAGTPE